ncbi:hypothetical protein [Streptomyces sp. NPDC017940]|uniref:hypothetical protein n=1 Tax=Streptomyces sp. NPDC017940 TaxID=3365017 RepID=UPI0037AA613D
MLPENMRAITVEAGVAVVETAGTALWGSLEQRVVSWLTQVDGQAERTGIVRLTETAAALRTGGGRSASIAARHALDWHIYFTEVLEHLHADVRIPAAERLRRLVSEHSAVSTGVSPAAGGIAGENLRVQADHGSFAAGVVNGDIHMASPPVPDPAQG